MSITIEPVQEVKKAVQMQVEIKDDCLVLTCPINENLPISKKGEGNTRLVASARHKGPILVDGTECLIKGHEITVQVNAHIPKGEPRQD